MLEKDIEKAVCDYAKKEYDAIPYKFTSPQRRSVPDRMIVFPNGEIVFMEFKAPGKKATEAQMREIVRLRDRGQIAHVVNGVDVGKFWVDCIGQI